MDTFNIDPQTIVDPRELVIRVLPSPDANRLFIYTGIISDLTHAGLASVANNLNRTRVILNLSQLHHRKFDGRPYTLIFVDGRLLAAPVASLASIAADEGGIVFAVNRADVDEDNEDLRLLIDLAVSGDTGSLHRVSYQVNVLVTEVGG